jgi:hypothetical protein
MCNIMRYTIPQAGFRPGRIPTAPRWVEQGPR